MSMCPLCNGFNELEVYCSVCGKALRDFGKGSDYMDDYSPYMEIDIAKKSDGYPDTVKEGKCPHLMSCSSCGHDKVVFVDE